MRNINIHELQAQISSAMRNVEKGESYQVMRYSEPVAVVLPLKAYHQVKADCRLCVEHWRKVTGRQLRKPPKARK